MWDPRRVGGQAVGGRSVEKSRRSRYPGRVVRIDLGDGTCAYGRQLLGVRVEFYHRIGSPDEPIDLLEVVATPVAFAVAVMDRAFRHGSRWQLLDVVSLSDEEKTTVYRSAKKDPISGRLSIYWEDPAAGTYGETPATPDECLALEPAAVWDPEHVEERLHDHFNRRSNRWVESLRKPFLDATS